MNDHQHNWQPVPMECGRYACACGVIGRREHGGIVPYAKPPSRNRRGLTKHHPESLHYSRFTAEERELNRTERLADPRYWQDPEVVR